jgi:hypothetical protein
MLEGVAETRHKVSINGSLKHRDGFESAELESTGHWIPVRRHRQSNIHLDSAVSRMGRLELVSSRRFGNDTFQSPKPNRKNGISSGRSKLRVSEVQENIKAREKSSDSHPAKLQPSSGWETSSIPTAKLSKASSNSPLKRKSKKKVIWDEEVRVQQQFLGESVPKQQNFKDFSQNKQAKQYLELDRGEPMSICEESKGQENSDGIDHQQLNTCGDGEISESNEGMDSDEQNSTQQDSDTSWRPSSSQENISDMEVDTESCNIMSSTFRSASLQSLLPNSDRSSSSISQSSADSESWSHNAARQLVFSGNDSVSVDLNIALLQARHSHSIQVLNSQGTEVVEDSERSRSSPNTDSIISTSMQSTFRSVPEAAPW